MKLGVYVGSFNPPHKGHMKVAEYLLESKVVDKVIILPTPNYWNKIDLVDIDKRVDMLRIFESEDIIVDGINNNYPYTYQVLRALQASHQNDELFLVIGSDNLETLHLWKNIDEILKYKIIVLKRGNVDIDKCLEGFDQSRFIVMNDFQNLDISSTEIRKNLNSEYLDERVLTYIKKNHLYGAV